ncbi:MAG: acetate--CoA ligase family protein [Candidatus Micrarchaeota archaeon]|nr:acetate--CoA ligase family protein [Candidatus Micrarchaeota archaeon]
MPLEEFKLLEKYGFKLLPYGLAKSEAEAIAFAKKIGYPIVMKLISSQATHKTDIGGVKVGIKNEITLKLAYNEILENAKAHKIKEIDGILVQKMARKGLELIIGGKKDPQFGHMIILGFGGIYVEVFRDVTARLCPITRVDIREMVTELKSHPLIEGARGNKGINMTALEQMMLRTCKFMEKENVLELDLNPVVFDDSGCDLIDVRFTKVETGKLK